MLGFRWEGAALLGALALVGCADLETVSSEVCGNGVVDSNEDCDQKNATGSTYLCGQPGEAGACQWQCQHGGGVQCPYGFMCGVDDLCRKPVSPPSWTAAQPVAESPAQAILVDDFNGDGVDDAVAVTSGAVDLHYFETTGTSTTSAAIVAYGANPSVGVLTGGGYPSLALDLSQGLGVFNGGSDGTLTPTPYPALTVDKGQIHANAFVIDTTTPSPNTPPGDTSFFVYQQDAATDTGISIFTPSTGSFTSFVSYMANDVRSGEGVVAQFNTALKCGQLAMAFDPGPKAVIQRTHVTVWTPCPLVDDMPPAMPRIADLTLNNLQTCASCPSGQTCTPCQPLFVADVDFDGNEDLVVVDKMNQLHVAYSDGLGGFSSTPGGPPTATIFGDLGTITTDDGTSSPPLAIADLNGDCAMDIVTADGIYVSYGVPPPTGGVCSHLTAVPMPAGYVSYASPDGTAKWTSARIADVDADGLPDVIVGSDAYPDVTVYRGTATALFNPYTIPTQAPIRNLTTGDFDGDLVPDILYAEVGPPPSGSTIEQDTLYVSFGAASGPLSSPVAVGQVQGVSQLIAVTEQSIYDDLIDNAFVSAFDDATGASTDVFLFAGNSARQIDAPYFLLQPSPIAKMGTFGAPVRSVMGSFSGRKASANGPSLGDIAVFATPLCPTGSCATASPLWLLTTTGDAALPAANELPSLIVPTGSDNPLVGVGDALLADLGPAASGSNDQLVVAVPSGTSTNLFLPTVMTNGSLGTFQVPSQPAASLTGFDISGASSSESGATIGAAQILAADVDGDGLLDVVLASPSSGLAIVLWDGAGFTKPTMLAYDDVLGACPGATSGTMKPNLSVAAFPKTTSSKQQALVAATPGGMAIVGYDTKSGMLVSNCLVSVGSTVGDVASDGSVAVSGGSAVGVGDFNGDGIQDFIVSEMNGLVVYYGQAYSPGGQPPTSSSSQAVVGGAE